MVTVTYCTSMRGNERLRIGEIVYHLCRVIEWQLLVVSGGGIEYMNYRFHFKHFWR